MSSSMFSRRSLLQTLGLGTGAYCLPSLLGSDRAARAATPPKRLVVCWCHHGTVYDAWKMRQGGSDTADWSFSLTDPNVAWSRIMKPLQPFANQVLVVDGVSMSTVWADNGPGNEHSMGEAHSLTGAMSAGDAVGGGPSIDQIVAGVNNRAGGLKSLELAVGGHLPATFAGRSQPVPPTQSATDAFKRLFPNGVPSGGATTTPTPPPAVLTDADRIKRSQAKVLQLAQAQFDALVPKLSTDDRTKIALHRDLMSDLSKRFADTSSTSGGPSASGGSLAACTAVAPSSIAEYKAQAGEMIKVIVGGLACDQTRVISMQLAQVPNSLVGVSDGEDLHNEYIHDVTNSRHPNSVEVLTQQNLVYADAFAQLLAALKAVPEAGGTMLDNTVCVWAYELATGDHSFRNIPIVIAGNANGYFNTGRVVHYGPKYPAISPYDSRTIGPGHNQYLVTVANALGVVTDKVGETSVKAANGQSVPLTGILPELKA